MVRPVLVCLGRVWRGVVRCGLDTWERHTPGFESPAHVSPAMACGKVVWGWAWHGAAR